MIPSFAVIFPTKQGRLRELDKVGLTWVVWPSEVDQVKLSWEANHGDARLRSWPRRGSAEDLVQEVAQLGWLALRLSQTGIEAQLDWPALRLSWASRPYSSGRPADLIQRGQL